MTPERWKTVCKKELKSFQVRFGISNHYELLRRRYAAQYGTARHRLKMKPNQIKFRLMSFFPGRVQDLKKKTGMNIHWALWRNELWYRFEGSSINSTQCRQKRTLFLIHSEQKKILALESDDCFEASWFKVVISLAWLQFALRLKNSSPRIIKIGTG